ncbi:MAG TPA: hypothetical protein VHX38_31795 [Pseudonocardiaceae bacterium]|jgi:hypothetical protein|nr:hypothetical protein [Pseudonocardiaceae bacterium]
MKSDPTRTPHHLATVLDLLSASQIAELVYGRYTLFGDLHERVQPKPIDRLASKQLRLVNADGIPLEDALHALVRRDPDKVLAVVAFLKDTSRRLGAADMAKRLEATVRQVNSASSSPQP